MGAISIIDVFGEVGMTNDRIYVISSRKRVEYIGMAGVQCVADRMARHIGNIFTAKTPSRFSRLLLKNHASYFGWKIKILSRSEIEKLIKDRCDCLSCAEKKLYDYYRGRGQKISGNAARPRSRCTAQ
jgi:hypothetical protein